MCVSTGTMPAWNDPARMADRLLVGDGYALPASSGRKVRQATPMPSYRLPNVCHSHPEGLRRRVLRTPGSSAPFLFERLGIARSMRGGGPRCVQNDEKVCKRSPCDFALTAAFSSRNPGLAKTSTPPLKKHLLAPASAACVRDDAYELPTRRISGVASVVAASS